MKRKIFLLMIVLLSILMLSCKNKNNDDFKNGMLYGVDLDSQNEIVQTFKNIYNIQVDWCNPSDDLSSFDNLNDFNEYIKTNRGFRIYGKFSDTYVICEFREPMLASVTNYIMFEDIIILDTMAVFNTQLSKIYIYSNGELKEIIPLGYTNIEDFFTKKEALEIKINNEKYSEKYFGKFMNEKDSNVNAAYDRIYTNLLNNEVHIN